MKVSPGWGIMAWDNMIVTLSAWMYIPPKPAIAGRKKKKQFRINYPGKIINQPALNKRYISRDLDCLQRPSSFQPYLWQIGKRCYQDRLK